MHVKVTKIYLDMDGVIADFDRHYKELYRISPRDADMKKEFYKLFDHFIETQQFAKLPMMQDAKLLLQYLDSTGIPIEILSSTSSEKRHDAIAHKNLVG